MILLATSMGSTFARLWSMQIRNCHNCSEWSLVISHKTTIGLKAFFMTHEEICTVTISFQGLINVEKNIHNFSDR